MVVAVHLPDFPPVGESSPGTDREKKPSNASPTSAYALREHSSGLNFQFQIAGFPALLHRAADAGVIRER
jgi:hypothetical protein